MTTEEPIAPVDEQPTPDPDSAAPEDAGELDDWTGAAPTDMAQNAWMLIIVLGVVLLAWGLTLFAKDEPKKPVANQSAPQQPTDRRPQQPRRRTPPPIYQGVSPVTIMGEERMLLPATPMLRLPTGLPWRRPTSFDITERADDFTIEQVARYGTPEERYADRRTLISLAGDDARDGDFLPARDVKNLYDEDRLVVLRRGGTVTAWPVRLLHLYCAARGAVLAELDDTPVLLIWHNRLQLPRCFALNSKFNAKAAITPTFRDAGLAWRGADMLYDEETLSLWDTLSGRAKTGPRKGDALEEIPASVVMWKTWVAAHEDVPVFMRAAGQLLGPKVIRGDGRPYERPTQRQDVALPILGESRMMFPTAQNLPAYPKLPPGTIVLGIVAGEKARAYPLMALAVTRRTTLKDDLGDVPVTVTIESDRVATAIAAGDHEITYELMTLAAWRELHPKTDVNAEIRKLTQDMIEQMQEQARKRAAARKARGSQP